MEIKKLIVSGCSFTQGHMLSENETWGGYLAKKLNLDFLNLAMGGQGNEYISNKIITHFLNNPKDKENSLVVIGWSDASRLMGTFENGNGYIKYVTIQPQDFNPEYTKNWPDDENFYHGYVKKNYNYLSKFFSSYAYCIYKTYLSIFILRQYLESNNIPYLFFDAINQNKLEGIEISNNNQLVDRYIIKYKTHGHDEIRQMEENIPQWILPVLNQEVQNTIFDTNKFISFGGHSMLSYMFKIDYEGLTKGNKGHPNSKAANMFADLIKLQYERIYNKR